MARQIVYRFNGNPSTDETENDFDDSIQIPAIGSMYSHNGKVWFVSRVLVEEDLRGPRSIPKVRIFLIEER
jgi:hypothetical protein